jgi:indole-3-glycerol phosphate synthase
MWIVLLKVHDEREMDRVLGIDGIQLIGINNRNLGMTLFSMCSTFFFGTYYIAIRDVY